MALKVTRPHSWRVVTDPGAVRLLTQFETRQWLQPFLLSSLSVKAFSERFDCSLNAAHYRLKRFEAAELIAVTRLEPRRGRAIKHYKATADGFFVPFSRSTAPSFERFMLESTAPLFSQFIQRLTGAGEGLVRDPEEAGFRLYNAGGYVNSDFSPRGQGFDLMRALLAPEAPALMLSFTSLGLSRERAKALQREMTDLLARYALEPGPEPYLVHVGLTPGSFEP